MTKQTGGLVVSLDGPASSGKTTAGAAAALRMSYRFFDSGLAYRAMAWLVRSTSVDVSTLATARMLAEQIQFEPDSHRHYRRVLVNGNDISSRLHTAEVDSVVSGIAQLPAVRGALLPLQRTIAASGSVIVAGRDIGTVVLPNANLKLYLDVSASERARRRALERGLRPGGQDAAQIKASLATRDRDDMTRAVAPLRIPEGAVIIRSDDLTLAQTTEQIVTAIQLRLRQLRSD